MKRLEHLKFLIHEHQPHMICIQETRTDDKKFPRYIEGYYGYHCHNGGKAGVALFSPTPLEPVEVYTEPGRLIIMTDGTYHYGSVYMHSGFSASSPVANKLKFFQHIQMLNYDNLILGGDWNVVYQTNELNFPNPFSTPEINALQKLETKLVSTSDHKHLTWFDYRTFRMNSLGTSPGMTLDKIFISPGLKFINTQVLFKYRLMSEPSDHIPVITTVLPG